MNGVLDTPSYINIYSVVYSLNILLERSEYEPLQYGYFKIFFNHSLNVSHIPFTISVSHYFQSRIPLSSIICCVSRSKFATEHDINSKQFGCQLLPTDKYRNLDHYVMSQEFHHYVVPVGVIQAGAMVMIISLHRCL